MQSIGSPGHRDEVFCCKDPFHVGKNFPFPQNNFVGKLVNLPTYVLSGCDKKTASDENNHSGLGEAKQLSWMLVSMLISIIIMKMFVMLVKLF